MTCYTRRRAKRSSTEDAYVIVTQWPIREKADYHASQNGGVAWLLIALPYGRSQLTGHVPEWAATDTLIPKQWHTSSQENSVETALKQPIGVPRLRELARESRSAVIVTCDRTRGVPSHVTIPLILKELRSGGINLDRV